ncbi:MAG: hypothetical protein ACLSTT_03540 [Evtepia gabavorous]
MAKKRKWGRVLAFGAITAALGGIAAYKHRKEIERTLQEIADQMDAWEESSEFFTDQDTVVHTVNPAPEEGEEAPAAENEPAESDFVDAAPAETEESPLRQSDSLHTDSPPSVPKGGGRRYFHSREEKGPQWRSPSNRPTRNRRPFENCLWNTPACCWSKIPPLPAT